MKKILVTGASGFVGKNLTRYCKENGLETVALNLRTGLPVSLPDGIDAIVHLAGKAHDLNNTSHISEYFEINTELTKKLFDQFLLSEASVFIFMSSVKAAANTVRKGVLTEDDEPHPETAYGQSKLQAETYLLSKTLPPGKRLYILRPCMIHGPGNKGNLNLLYQVVRKGIPYPLAAFENRRSFLSVVNLCFVIRELIERDDIRSGIYNIADDTPLATNDVIRIIAEESAKTARLWRVNKSVVKTLARFGDIIHLPLNTTRLNKLTENYVVSTEKLKSALRKPLPVDSEEGLRKSIQSFSQPRL